MAEADTVAIAHARCLIAAGDRGGCPPCFRADFFCHMQKNGVGVKKLQRVMHA